MAWTSDDDINALLILHDTAKDLHALLRDDSIPWDNAYLMGYSDTPEHETFRRFEDALLRLGPLEKSNDDPEGRLVPR